MFGIWPLSPSVHSTLAFSGNLLLAINSTRDQPHLTWLVLGIFLPISSNGPID